MQTIATVSQQDDTGETARSPKRAADSDRRQVLGLKDFGADDLRAICTAEPPPESAAFDDESVEAGSSELR